MILGVSAEQEELRASVRRFLADRVPITAVRELMETADGGDPAVWETAGQQLGLQGLAIPEEYGGSGFTFAEQAIVLEELGAALYGGPYLASAVIAASALLASGDESAKKAYLPGIASGELIATLAFTEEDGSWEPDATRLTATPAPAGGDGRWRLDGRKSFVLDGHAAGLILVAGRTAAGLSLFAVPGDAAGLTRTPLPTLDQTRKLARLDFDAVPATLVGTDGEGGSVLSRTLDIAAIAQAAEQLGGAQRALDMAVEYAKVRHQFGRPIGSFQAISHRCADILVALEGARSQVMAASDIENVADSDESEYLVDLAAAAAFDAAVAATEGALQIHGGLGFTWEHPVHLLLRRAAANAVLVGRAEALRDRAAGAVLSR
jgi:alkylation response protein AidB-like acyl-CoA dehydrogenase